MRKIYCYKCQCYLGEIRDATLKKGILFLCAICYNKTQMKDYNKTKTKSYDLPPGFEDLFGGFGRSK